MKTRTLGDIEKDYGISFGNTKNKNVAFSDYLIKNRSATSGKFLKKLNAKAG